MLNLILIDPVAFAQTRDELAETVVLNQLDERIRSHEYLANTDAQIHFTLKGGVDNLTRCYLDLSIQAQLPLLCQRCLEPISFAVDEVVRITLFKDEVSIDEAMLTDPDLDGIVVEPELSVLALVEDQLIMALPFSPMHDVCDNEDIERINRDKPNPFAALAGLKKSQ
jgi:uncharacterized protein